MLPIPVTLPPGREGLATRPEPTGSTPVMEPSKDTALNPLRCDRTEARAALRGHFEAHGRAFDLASGRQDGQAVPGQPQARCIAGPPGRTDRRGRHEDGSQARVERVLMMAAQVGAFRDRRGEFADAWR